jgi:hypothetical protein
MVSTKHDFTTAILGQFIALVTAKVPSHSFSHIFTTISVSEILQTLWRHSSAAEKCLQVGYEDDRSDCRSFHNQPILSFQPMS